MTLHAHVGQKSIFLHERWPQDLINGKQGSMNDFMFMQHAGVQRAEGTSGSQSP